MRLGWYTIIQRTFLQLLLMLEQNRKYGVDLFLEKGIIGGVCASPNAARPVV